MLRCDEEFEYLTSVKCDRKICAKFGHLSYTTKQTHHLWLAAIESGQWILLAAGSGVQSGPLIFYNLLYLVFI